MSTALSDDTLRPCLVSAVMLIGDPGRLSMARVAVRCFEAQTYPEKELVVVNSTGAPLFPGEAVREVLVPAGSLGELRNAGLEAAAGEWVCQWDDDDWSDPRRIEFQMACRREGACCLLRRQVRVDVRLSRGALRVYLTGAPGTTLFPRTHRRYRKLIRWDADLFLEDHYPPPGRRVLADCPGSPLHVAFWHGRNVTPPDEFLPDAPAGVGSDVRGLLARVLVQYGASLSDDGTRIVPAA